VATVAATVVAARVGGGQRTGRFCGGNARKRTRLSRRPEVLSPGPEYRVLDQGNTRLPIYQKPYPIPVSKAIRIDQEIQRMIDLGIIEHSNSPWSSPMVGVEKKNGDVRVCLDARRINSRIITDLERPMNMKDIMNKFRGVKYLSSIDLTAGYWQCLLKKECREITAFLHKGRNYHYKALPFGLINSVAEFQKILDIVLGPEILQFVAIYMSTTSTLLPTASLNISDT